MPERNPPKDVLYSTEWQQPLHETSIRNEGDHRVTDLGRRTGLGHSDDGGATKNHSLSPAKSKDSKTSLGYWKTSEGLKGRVAFAKSKSLQQLILEDREKLHRARKLQHAKDLKAKLDAENKAVQDQRKADKQVAKRYNKEKKRREAEEDRNNKKWGGIVRGFDPNAGLLRGAASEDTLRHPRDELFRNHNIPASLTDDFAPRLGRGQTWGVEHGSQGRKGRIGISSPTSGGNLGGLPFDGGDD